MNPREINTDFTKALIAAAHEGIAGVYAGMNRRLDGREFFFDQFTVADIGYVLATMFATSLGVPPPADCKNVNDWFARLGQRPSVAAELQGMSNAASAA